MKDEEMADKHAEEYRKNFRYYRAWHGQVVDKSPSTIVDQSFKDGFLAGLKAGRPQWHNLRKDPNDLPKEENRIMLCYCCIGYHGNIGTYVYRLYTKKEFHKVIAWCELPTFDKE